MRQSALQFIREYYGKSAHKAGMVMVEHPLHGTRSATIISGKRISNKRAKLRVRFDDATRTSLIDPAFGVQYLGE